MLVVVPGVVIKALALVALFSGPIAWLVGRLRERPLRGEDALVYGWFAIVSVALFVLGAPAVTRDGLGSAIRHTSTFVEAWRVVPIYSYGVLLATGILMGCFAGYSLAKRIAVPPQKYWAFCAVAAASALAGARGLYLFVQWKAEFVSATGQVLWERVLYPRANGFVVYGGFIAGVVGVTLFAKKTRTLVWQWTDIATVGMPLGLAFGRLGCFLAGCDFGMALSPSAPSWLQHAGTFPKWPSGEGSPAWWQHTHAGVRLAREACEHAHGIIRDGRCVLPSSISESVAVHPTQLYELALGLVLFAWQRWLWPRRRFDGQVSLSFMVLYGLARSGLELVRDDIERGTSGGLTTSQWIGLTSAAAGVLWYAWRARTAGAAAKELSTVS
ncbi:MAG: prolipoprotein diacylglyceryl transferase [Myxococcales bacterium]|nr:prolipoprotein diacylglyceryl transferase [Myxococcales bacterium]